MTQSKSMAFVAACKADKFRISEHQYRYQFIKKWGWKKNVSSKIKDKIVSRAQQRAAAGKSTAVTYQDKPIEMKIRRHAKELARRRNIITLSERASNSGFNIFGHSSIFRNRM